MKKLTFSILLIAVCGAHSFAQKKPEKIKTCISQEEYEVYSAIGVGNFETQTASAPSSMLENHFSEISPETIADFNEKNSKVYLLRCVTRPDGKEKKLKRYFGTTSSISFSRIGFGKDGNQALVHYSWDAPGNQCSSDFYLLEKKNGKWEVTKKHQMVIC